MPGGEESAEYRTMNKRKAITYFTLLVLLTIRFLAGNFVSILNQFSDVPVPSTWMGTLESARNIAYYLWERCSFVLTGVLILLYRGNLRKINIDRGFLVLFIIGGILFGISYFLPAGWIGLLISGYITYMLLKNKFEFKNDTRPSFQQVTIILFVAFILYWFFMITFIGVPLIDKYVSFFLIQFPVWLVEEVVFRGLLWMCMEELGLHDLMIIFVQALIFGLFHIYYMFSNPLLFWLLIPTASIVMGILVSRYKSITPSSILHTLFNLR